MKRAPKKRHSPAATSGAATPDETPAILQFRVWLEGLSTMVWRRVQVPSTITLREFHGVLQVAMGWDAIHLGQFFVQSGCYGSCELSAESANIVLNDLKLRRQPGCTNTVSTFPGSMEIQLEELCSPEPRTHYPGFIGDGGTCQPQYCGRTEAWIRQLEDARGYGLATSSPR